MPATCGPRWADAVTAILAAPLGEATENVRRNLAIATAMRRVVVAPASSTVSAARHSVRAPASSPCWAWKNANNSRYAEAPEGAARSARNERSSSTDLSSSYALSKRSKRYPGSGRFRRAEWYLSACKLEAPAILWRLRRRRPPLGPIDGSPTFRPRRRCAPLPKTNFRQQSRHGTLLDAAYSACSFSHYDRPRMICRGGDAAFSAR